MEAIGAARREQWTFAQKGVLVLAVLQLAWATAGLIAEPTFSMGESAPTTKVLGVDFNGIHAVSGFLLFLPAFYFMLRPKWALYYAIYVAVALWATGIWALFSTQPAWVFTFPNNSSDGIFHLATGTLFAIVAAVQIAQDRQASS
jgi:membrane-associated PAP2 superfamily phosphatase